MCERNNRNFYVLIAVIVVILVGVSVFVTHTITKQKYEAHMHTDTQTSKLTGDLGDITQNDLRINAKNDTCIEPSCITCKAVVTPKIEPLDCATTNLYIKNASCFLCTHNCLTFLDLLGKSGKRLACPKSVKIDCCTLSTMGRLSNYCGKGNQYNCFFRKVHKMHGISIHEPICTCPAGSHTVHCRKPYTEIFINLDLHERNRTRCRCYKPKGKFCREERMMHCNDITRRWKTCYMDIVRLSETYKCICNKLKMEIDDQLTECSSQ